MQDYTFPLLTMLRFVFHSCPTTRKWSLAIVCSLLQNKSSLWKQPSCSRNLVWLDLLLHLEILKNYLISRAIWNWAHYNYSLLLVQPLLLFGGITCSLPTNFLVAQLSFVDSFLRKLKEYLWHKDSGMRHNLNCQHNAIYLESSLKQPKKKPDKFYKLGLLRWESKMWAALFYRQESLDWERELTRRIHCSLLPNWEYHMNRCHRILMLRLPNGDWLEPK